MAPEGGPRRPPADGRAACGARVCVFFFIALWAGDPHASTVAAVLSCRGDANGGGGSEPGSGPLPLVYSAWGEGAGPAPNRERGDVEGRRREAKQAGGPVRRPARGVLPGGARFGAAGPEARPCMRRDAVGCQRRGAKPAAGRDPRGPEKPRRGASAPTELPLGHEAGRPIRPKADSTRRAKPDAHEEEESPR